VVTLYLFAVAEPEADAEAQERAQARHPHRVARVRHGDWKPEKELDVNGRKVYYWTIPKK
jgi:Ni/Co efflux regulator RcnB